MATHRSHLLPTATGGPLPPISRRHHVGQPPNLLTTALSGAHSHHTGLSAGSQQPHSATSLSAPFSPYPASPYSPSPSTEMRDSSPMAARSQSNFGTPYNPQQWGPLSSSTSSPLEPATRTRPSTQSARFPRFAPRPAGPDGKKL